jgi:hypothetical protein
MADTCRSCNAPIIWAITVKGRRIPIDKAPVENGNVTLAMTPGFTIPWAIMGPNGTHVSHFATCEFAHRHRKRQRKGHPVGERRRP